MSRQRPHAHGCECFGCKVGSIGFDGRHLIRTVRDEAGNDVRSHRDGSVDVRINAKTVKVKAALQQ